VHPGADVGCRYRFPPFELDPAEARLARDGEPVELQPKVLDALALFAERAGQLVSKDDLMARLWPDVVVTEESLTQVVRKLRQALGDDPAAPRFLETVPKRGYRFVAPVERIDLPPQPSPAVPAPAEAGGASAGGAPGPAEAAAPRQRAVRTATAALFAVFGLLAAAAVVLRVRREPPNPLLAGGEPRRITSSAARESSPAIARDGRFAAVAVNSGPGGSLDLLLVPLDGGRPIQLTETDEDEWEARFSPDGRELLFLRSALGGGQPALWAMGVFGGAERRLAPHAASGDWAPGGGAVAFARPLERGAAIELLDLASGARRELARSAGRVSSLGFSPDGSRLAYLDEQTITLLALDAGAPRPLGAPARHVRTVAWESEASLLTDAAWSDGASRISRLRLPSGRLEPLLAGPPGVHELALSASGRMVYLAEHKTRQVWKFAPDGGGAALVDLPTTVEGFDVDARGARLAFTDWDPAPGFGTLGLLDLARGARRDLGDGLCPALSHDGGRVAALGDRAGESGLWLVQLATGERQRVAPDRRPPGRSDAALFRCAEFSRDGRAIAYLAVGDDGRDGVWLAEPESGQVRRVAVGSFGAPSFAPDGSRLALCDHARAPATVRIVPLDGGPARETPLVCPYRARPLWESNAALWLVEEQKTAPKLVLRRLDGGRERELKLALPVDLGFWGVFEVRRTADGSWFALAERYESDLFLLEGGVR
jgi:DNA-binding winged helix-turn-helix (wHTH) protein/dipeptidyl aminopeptidase/acylaminoacyl peptidase